jgi:AGZA family xanthine/uracil permease-like MFS transporter
MFDIQARGSTVGREILGGVTIFVAMSYILFVQPAVLAPTGMDKGGVFMATCLSAAAGCLLVGLIANFPLALAPGMGENFFFTFTLCGVGAAAGVFALTWQEALALTAIAGAVFLFLALVGLRSKLLDCIPDSIKSGIIAGLGLFIALIGFEWGNLITDSPRLGFALASLSGNYVAALTLVGLAITFTLIAWGVRGAILIGIIATTALTWLTGKWLDVETISWGGLVAWPSGITQTAGGAVAGFGTLAEKFTGGHSMDILVFGFLLLFMNLFDTLGTMVGVTQRAGLMNDGKLPKGELALSANAACTIGGAFLGTSTVTAYIESIMGVYAGARTGLAAIVCGLCLLAAMFFQPLIAMIGGGVVVGQDASGENLLRYPMIAPAMIVVGAILLRAVREIEWDDYTEAIPAFLTIVAIPFTFSISAGIAIGFISYAVGKLVTGRAKECSLLVYVFALLFLLEHAACPILAMCRS